MRLLVLVLVFVLVLCMISSVNADAFKSEKQLSSFMNSVMAEVGEGNLRAAINKMKPYMTVPGSQVDEVMQNTEAARKRVAEVIGPTIGYEYIGQKRLGSSLLRTVYIEKASNAAITWIFIFYQSIDGWVLTSFNFEIDSPTAFDYTYD